MSIVAIIDDLFFLVQVQDMAKRAGIPIRSANTVESALAQPTTLAIVDLNARQSPVQDIIAALRDASIPTVAFVAHVQTDLKQQALDAGVDRVIARSAFSRVMPELIAQQTSKP
ncbi:hypothetical protein F183_A48860 [Bryobacterales bacterium F-183]|nr:hypothetical protein F183_A48860 [Bryobacterales bacterium F-183]